VGTDAPGTVFASGGEGLGGDRCSWYDIHWYSDGRLGLEQGSALTLRNRGRLPSILIFEFVCSGSTIRNKESSHGALCWIGRIDGRDVSLRFG